MIMKPVRILSTNLAIPTILLTTIACCTGELVLSDATNDVYISVFSEHTVISTNLSWMTDTVPMRYDDKLEVMTFCRTGAVNLLFPLDKSVFIKFQMRNTAGKEVRKTAEGLRWGSDAGHFPREPGMNNHNRMSPLGAIGSHTNGISSFTSGPPLPSANDLFEINDSGIYYLTMEVNLMKQRFIPGNWTWDHIVIPPVTVRINKP